MSDFSAWIGRSEVVSDELTVATAQAAAATFDENFDGYRAGMVLPPLWHWFYFLPRAAQCQLGNDGHPRRDVTGLMPPLALPRRMFAGARLTWHRPLVMGRTARREAVIRSIEQKSGRSGALAFVTVGYRYFQEGTLHSANPAHTGQAPPVDADLRREELCLEEEQDIVYREPGSPITPPQPVEWPAAPDGAWSRIIVPDTRLLFRFSALTFNAHRIHYDRQYATGEEGYPGLVVHGPLTAMLLLQLAREHTARPIASFRFRSQAPLFDLGSFRLVAAAANGRIELQAEGPDAKVAMTATAVLG